MPLCIDFYILPGVGAPGIFFILIYSFRLHILNKAFYVQDDKPLSEVRNLLLLRFAEQNIYRWNEMIYR